MNAGNVMVIPRNLDGVPDSNGRNHAKAVGPKISCVHLVYPLQVRTGGMYLASAVAVISSFYFLTQVVIKQRPHLLAPSIVRVSSKNVQILEKYRK